MPAFIVVFGPDDREELANVDTIAWLERNSGDEMETLVVFINPEQPVHYINAPLSQVEKALIVGRVNVIRALDTASLKVVA